MVKQIKEQPEKPYSLPRGKKWSKVTTLTKGMGARFSFNNLGRHIPFKETIKTVFLPPGEHEKAVLAGELKGMRFNFDLRRSTQLWRGIYERPLQRWLREYTKPDSVCLDIGAAEGYFTLLMAKLAGPGGAIHAFEPTSHLAKIPENINLNRDRFALAPITAHKCYVGDKQVQSVPPSVTVDDMVREASLERVDVIKIDVDGTEDAVLRGARQTLERCYPHLFVEVHSRPLLSAVRQITERYGYALHLEDASSYEHRPIEYNAFLFSDMNKDRET